MEIYVVMWYRFGCLPQGHKTSAFLVRRLFQIRVI
uniref:Uncharacterized protein n=1 Tax=Arundo donax TaxID=35708 RepID=A0A0A9AZ13_ARUDO